MAARNISTLKKQFVLEIDRLDRLDKRNQADFSAGGTMRLLKNQLESLTEFLFLSGFRAYECFIGLLFAHYCCEAPHSSRKSVHSFLQPKSVMHASQLIKSSMHFIDWSSPDTVISRAELYLKDGFPFKLPFTTHRTNLSSLKKIRNHIAHNSLESLEEYKKVVKDYYSTIPLKIPSPGAFLLLPSKQNRHIYNLQAFFNLMKMLSNELT